MKKTNFRKMTTKNGTLILAGKNDESNEKLIEQVEKDEEVFHTKEAGSPKRKHAFSSFFKSAAPLSVVA